MTIATFEDVIAWQKAKLFYIELFNELRGSKDYIFKNQLLRAALSISNNIAEGFNRGTNKELKQFLTIARGSAAEARSMLLIAVETKNIHPDTNHKLIMQSKSISRLLTGFIRSINQQNTDHRKRITNP